MRPALALLAAAALVTATAADARETTRRGAGRPAVLRLDHAQPGIGRCTSDGTCTTTRQDGTVVRAASVVSDGDVRRVARKARPSGTLLPTT